MKLILTGIAAGVLGTLVMDSLNQLFARNGMLLKIDVARIGRLSAGWARGRFRYQNPGEVPEAPNEKPIGYLAHYGIGIVLALVYVVGWDRAVGGPVSPVWAVAYGTATTVIAWFFLLPSIGLGVCGWNSPDGYQAPLSSLVNHVFFGLGMALVIALA